MTTFCFYNTRQMIAFSQVSAACLTMSVKWNTPPRMTAASQAQRFSQLESLLLTRRHFLSELQAQRTLLSGEDTLCAKFAIGTFPTQVSSIYSKGLVNQSKVPSIVDEVTGKNSESLRKNRNVFDYRTR